MVEIAPGLSLTGAIVFAVDLVIRIVAIFVVPRNRTPSSAVAWLMVILLFPIPGIIVFLILGATRLPKRRHEKQAQALAIMHEDAEEYAKRYGPDLSSLPQPMVNTTKLAQALGAQPMFAGNGAKITYPYKESLDAMAAAIRKAEEFVHVEFYALAYDKSTEDVFEALAEVAARGIPVRVLMDHIASLQIPGHKKTKRKLDELGATWSYMLPIRPFRGQWRRPDLRNHRKLLVIDGRVAFIGSQNLIDASYNKRKNIKKGMKWRDIMAELEGPVVASINRVFMTDWFVETGEILEDVPPTRIENPGPEDTLDCQILPSGPGFGAENNLQVFLSLMNMATERISITSPYFIPDQAILYALQAATARGVKVELFVSEAGDQAMVYHAQRSYYEALLRAGVRIYMFKAPYILHSKHFTIDHSAAVVGSSNMDLRSFNLNMEVSMIVYGEGFVDQLDRVNEFYLENSRELTAEEWAKQPLFSQLLDGIFRLTSSLQ